VVAFGSTMASCVWAYIQLRSLSVAPLSLSRAARPAHAPGTVCGMAFEIRFMLQKEEALSEVSSLVPVQLGR
jgi:hypothetical protein